jgi:hypothetical protein
MVGKRLLISPVCPTHQRCLASDSHYASRRRPTVYSSTQTSMVAPGDSSPAGSRLIAWSRSTRSSAGCGVPRHGRKPNTPSMASNVGLIRLSRSHTSPAVREGPRRNSIRTANRALRGWQPASATPWRTASFHGASPAVAKVAGRPVTRIVAMCRWDMSEGYFRGGQHSRCHRLRVVDERGCARRRRRRRRLTCVTTSPRREASRLAGRA